jgi:Protein of unknown function (DUF4089)
VNGCHVAGQQSDANVKRIPVRPGHDEQERTLTTQSHELLDDNIDIVAKALALPVEEAWRPAVRANVEVSLRLARLVDEFVLPDEIEPASVFTA